MQGFLVMNIGCIECGVSSNIVGFYVTKEEADAVAEKCQDSLSWREHGQNSFEVFDCSAQQANEYKEALK